MGHIRLSRLPRSRPWKAVVELMRSPALDAQTLGSAALRASTDALKSAKDDRGCSEPLRILSLLALGSRSASGFDDTLDHLGVSSADRDDGARLLGALTRAATEAAAPGPSSILTNIADRTYRDVLLNNVQAQAGGLFEATPEDIRAALKRLGTPAGYRDLTQEWFGGFIGRAIQAVVDRELPNVVGVGPIGSSSAANELHRELMAFAQERTRILQDFAPGWLSKALWQEGELRPATFRRFFSYAIEKILRDIGREGPPS